MKCPFKIGEKIVCIKRYEISSMSPATTIGKTYEVYDNPHLNFNTICIRADHGCSIKPNWDFFVTLKEYRKIKLETLNKKI